MEQPGVWSYEFGVKTGSKTVAGNMGKIVSKKNKFGVSINTLGDE